MEKNGNKKEMQADVIFYSSLLSLPFRYCKLRLAQTKIRSRRFHNVIIAEKIARFLIEKKFLGLKRIPFEILFE